MGVAVIDDTAIFQPDDALRLHGDGVVMGDEDDGVALFVQVLEHPQNFAAGVAVQSAGGFVGEDDRRVPGQRTGDGHALLLTTGKLIGLILELGAEAHPLEGSFRFRVALSGGDAGVDEGDFHVLEKGELRQQIVLLEDEAQLLVPDACQLPAAHLAGSPGELKGHFLSAHAIGTIRINGENGVYGTTRTHFSGQLREIAFAQEVVTGPAEIWATIEGEVPRAYRIQIERVSDADPRRNLVIRVTDPSLLSATGGIVQGMSGSPILQNGRLVGAVTHVLVNDPTRGYGIFAQTMLEQAKNAVQNGAEAQTAE